MLGRGCTGREGGVTGSFRRNCHLIESPPCAGGRGGSLPALQIGASELAGHPRVHPALVAAGFPTRAISGGTATATAQGLEGVAPFHEKEMKTAGDNEENEEDGWQAGSPLAGAGLNFGRTDRGHRRWSVLRKVGWGPGGSPSPPFPLPPSTPGSLGNGTGKARQAGWTGAGLGFGERPTGAPGGGGRDPSQIGRGVGGKCF